MQNHYKKGNKMIPKSTDKKIKLWKSYLKHKKQKQKTVNVTYVLDSDSQLLKHKNTFNGTVKRAKKVYDFSKLNSTETIVFYHLGLLDNRKKHFDYLRQLLKDNELEKTNIKNIEKIIGFKLSK